MLEKQNIAARLEGMGYTMTKVGGEDYKATKITLAVDFTPELAADIPGAKGAVFKRNDGTPNDDVESLVFTYKSKAQRVELRSDPSMRPSSTLIDAECRRFRIPKRAKGAAPVLKFDVIVLEISANDMLTLKEALFEQRFFTFETMQTGMWFEAEAEARRESKDAAPVKKSRRPKDDDAETGEGVPLH
jgi:hypothetical protein